MKKGLYIGLLATTLLATAVFSSCSNSGSRHSNLENKVHRQEQVVEETIDTIADVVEDVEFEVVEPVIEPLEPKNFSLDLVIGESSLKYRLSETYYPDGTKKLSILIFNPNDSLDNQLWKRFEDFGIDSTIVDLGDSYSEGIGMGEGSYTGETITNATYNKTGYDGYYGGEYVEIFQETASPKVWQAVEEKLQSKNAEYQEVLNKISDHFDNYYDDLNAQISDELFLGNDLYQDQEKNNIVFNIADDRQIKITDADFSGVIGDSNKDEFQIGNLYTESSDWTSISGKNPSSNVAINSGSIFFSDMQGKALNFMSTTVNDLYQKGLEMREEELIDMIGK